MKITFEDEVRLFEWLEAVKTKEGRTDFDAAAYLLFPGLSLVEGTQLARDAFEVIGPSEYDEQMIRDQGWDAAKEEAQGEIDDIELDVSRLTQENDDQAVIITNLEEEIDALKEHAAAIDEGRDLP